MVPNKLTIENFKSYGSSLNPLDLNGVHIVCLSGQNGHGKSSLLDAICWSIWGDEVHRPQDELVKKFLLSLSISKFSILFIVASIVFFKL